MTTIRLGVSGLRRTGKTVFLTALIHQLIQCGSRGLEKFDKGDGWWKYHLSPGEMSKRPGYLPFPYDEHLDRLRQESPRWPEPTVTEYGCELKLRCDWIRVPGWAPWIQSAITNARMKFDNTLTLQLYDYPGEYLLDAEMKSKPYESWSQEAVERIRLQCRSSEGQLYDRFAESTQYERLDDGVALDLATSRYVEYVRRFRTCDENRDIEFIQPSISMMPWIERLSKEPQSAPSPEELPFVPLPPSLRERIGLAETQRRAYRRYVAEKVGPFLDRVQLCDKHVFLVDLLRVATNGPDSYNDTRDCIRAVVKAFADIPLYRRLLWTSRLMFAATKADHVPRRDRPKLRRLLEEMVQAAKSVDPQCMRVSPSSIAFTSIRATEDDGDAALKGTRKDDAKSVRRESRTSLPEEWPSHSAGWDAVDEYPEYRPQRFPDINGKALPHLHFDEMVYWIFDGEYIGSWVV